MKSKNNDSGMTYNHMQDKLEGLVNHYVSMDKEKRALTTWYVVYEEVIIVSLLAVMLVTAL